jgi:ribonuclease VapC
VTLALDSSALVAVLLGEPVAEQLAALMLAELGDIHLSAASLVETTIVLEARAPAAVVDLHAVLRELSVVIDAVDEADAALAVAAWRRFGKGRHPASLNFGDCFSYALAKRLGAPLLCTGDDFAQTDLALAG